MTHGRDGPNGRCESGCTGNVACFIDQQSGSVTRSGADIVWRRDFRVFTINWAERHPRIRRSYNIQDRVIREGQGNLNVRFGSLADLLTDITPMSAFGHKQTWWLRPLSHFAAFFTLPSMATASNALIWTQVMRQKYNLSNAN